VSSQIRFVFPELTGVSKLADVIGRPVDELDTPALLLDLDICERNLKQMAAFFADRPAQLRPHFKNHKCTALARRQLDAGSAIGMTCAHIGEAEALAAAGIEDILIANQVVGAGKIQRLAELARHSRICVAVDDASQGEAISRAAQESGVHIHLLLEVDVGMGRCGLPPGQPSLELARRLIELPGVELRGLQAYEGHAVYIDDAERRGQQACEALRLAIETRDLLHASGIPADVISGSSSATYRFSGTMDGVTEVQAGTYATMDCRYQRLLPEFGVALSVLATVISTRSSEAVLDIGVKSAGGEFGVPRIKDAPHVEIPFFLAEEHCVVRNTPGWKIGELVEVYPSHACTTCNLHAQMFVHQQGRVVAVWPIDGRSTSKVSDRDI